MGNFCCSQGGGVSLQNNSKRADLLSPVARADILDVGVDNSGRLLGNSYLCHAITMMSGEKKTRSSEYGIHRLRAGSTNAAIPS